MHVISFPKLREFIKKHPSTAPSLTNWYTVAKSQSWRHIFDVKQVFPAADAVGNFTVFDIKGNDCRLVVDILYQRQIIYIKYVLTHAEYDKGRWKNDPYFKSN